MSKRLLEGQVALVTGAGRGLGRAFAERLAVLGCNIAVHGMREHGPSEYGGTATLSDVAHTIAATHGVRTMKVLGDLTRAVTVLGAAHTIFVLGLGGSFPVAAHLTYVLRKLGRRVVLLDGLGSALGEQAACATPHDALIAISFKTYNPDTVRLFPELVARKVPAVVITDSLLSPLVQGATVVFEIPDMPEAALRTMVAPMCLAQSLAVSLTLTHD